MTPQHMTIVEQLNEACLVNHIKIDRESLASKAEILSRYLAEWSPETIRLAFFDHVKKSKFLPTVSELVEGCRAASKRLSDNRGNLALPDGVVTLEDRRRNIERLKRLKQRLAEKRGI